MGIFGNMMNNYFYGKAGKGDYRIEDMPSNRFQLFGAVLKVRWTAMIGVNLLYVISWLPAALWTIVNLIMMMTPDSGVFEGGQLASYLTMYLLVLAPCILLTGPFSAGIAYVMRNWARDQHSFVWSDFWDAVKGNWKQAFLVSLISGIVPLVVYIGWQFYNSMAVTSSVFFYIPMALMLVLFIVWKLMEMVLYTMMVTYDLKFKDLLRNAFLLSMARLPIAVLIKLSTLIVPVIAFLVMLAAPGTEIYVFMIFGLLYLLFVPAFNRLIIASYANAVCEKYLNVKIEGAETNIGLRPEDWDDVEYIPQDDEEEQ